MPPRPEYQKRRNIRMGTWAAILVLCYIAWDSGEFSYWGLPLMAWGLYEMLLVPTRCRATTTRKGQCRHFCYGILKGCRQQPAHGPGKRADLYRALKRGRSQTMPVRTGETTTFRNQPNLVSETVTVQPAQRLMIVFTVIGGVAGVIQTVFAALSP
jgi:hypothetical protein